MDVLLDTHTAIWFFEDDKRLSITAAELILNQGNKIYVSIASLWELAIKIGMGKLVFDGGIDRFIESMEDNGFTLIAITPEHIKATIDLPLLHRDPFDRVLIAQAAIEDMAILTADANIEKYDITAIW